MKTATYSHTQLSQEYLARRARNARYSLRAFARDLGLSRSVLSSALSGKSKLSVQNNKKLKSKLGDEKPKRFMEISSTKFVLIEKWYYLPLLNLCYLSKQRASPLWISKQLGIRVSEAREGLNRLVNEGYLRIEKSRLIRTVPALRTQDDIPSQSIQAYHQAVLALAAAAVAHEKVDRRDFQSICFPLSKNRLREAKRRIRKFHRELSEFLEAGKGEEVFYLAIQLFPAKGVTPIEN